MTIVSTPSRLLTAEQLAARWQIKPSTVYAMSRKGSIPTVRLGRLYRYRLADIEAYEEAGGGARCP
jgi:excisionase family DNA binding protein